MGLVKRAADLAFTFRFVRMLVMKWEEWDAYKLGIIDDEGKRVRGVDLDTSEKKSAYTPFVRLAANVKRIIGKIPGGGSRLGSFASALYLIKEKHGVNDQEIDKILNKVGFDVFDFLAEQNMWFVSDDRQIFPGLYKIYDSKVINESCEEIVRPGDSIRIKDDCYPVGDIFGIDVYEATHMNTQKTIFVTASEIYK
jgi:hypothetical protein